MGDDTDISGAVLLHPETKKSPQAENVEKIYRIMLQFGTGQNAIRYRLKRNLGRRLFKKCYVQNIKVLRAEFKSVTS